MSGFGNERANCGWRVTHTPKDDLGDVHAHVALPNRIMHIHILCTKIPSACMLHQKLYKCNPFVTVGVTLSKQHRTPKILQHCMFGFIPFLGRTIDLRLSIYNIVVLQRTHIFIAPNENGSVVQLHCLPYIYTCPFLLYILCVCICLTLKNSRAILWLCMCVWVVLYVFRS